MRASWWQTTLSTAFLAGCGTIPDLPPVGYVRASDVTMYVQCQLQRAVQNLVYSKEGKIVDGHEWLTRWSGAAQLTLISTENANAAAGFEAFSPLRLTTYSLAPSLSASSGRSRQADVTFTFPILELARKDGASAQKLAALCATDPDGEARTPLLSGKLGIQEWLDEVVKATDIDDPIARPSAFSHLVEFGVARKAGLKPEFAAVRLTGGADLNFEVIQKVKLALTFTFDEDSVGLVGLLPRGRKDAAAPTRRRVGSGQKTTAPNVSPAAVFRLQQQLFYLQSPPLR